MNRPALELLQALGVSVTVAARLAPIGNSSPRRPATFTPTEAPPVQTVSLGASETWPGANPPASFAAALQAASAATGVSPALLTAVATVESDEEPNVVSDTGAIGYMQLEPATAASLGVNPYNPTQNVLGGAEYLAQQITTFHGNLVEAIAAYNAGPGAVETYGGIPPYAQTEAYVQAVLQHYQANLAAPEAP